jgi:Fic-DOC domain mobile mystery protein B
MEVTRFGEDPQGATPLSPDDMEGLRLSWVSTRAELDRAEAENILRGRTWAFSRRRAPYWYLDSSGCRDLHRRMLGDVWSWAGQLRTRETNIGVDPAAIAVGLHDALADVRAQIGDGVEMAYPRDELALRFHHRLVSIHPFRNGNGRHARLATDLLMRDVGGLALSWGGLDEEGDVARRDDYLAALRQADRLDAVTGLVSFARKGQSSGDDERPWDD